MKYSQKGDSELMIFASDHTWRRQKNELKTLKNNKNINKIIRHKYKHFFYCKNDDIKNISFHRNSLGVQWLALHYFHC